MKIISVIMAGGKGERFWPKSRQKLPKQFLTLTDNGSTMLQLTADRVVGFSNSNNIFVVTNKEYANLVTKQLVEVDQNKIIKEPVGKNTAPCVAVAAAIISKIYGDAIMVVLPADHLVKNNTVFNDTVKSAIDHASENKALVTIGVLPNYPETGYGYIHYERCFSGAVSRVIKFVEKPDIITAKEYLHSKEYLWNSGIFIWKTSVILDKFKELEPDIYSGAMKIADSYGSNSFDDMMNVEFEKFKSISIDYAIMERCKDIATIAADFGWNDVGSWVALDAINDKDSSGNVVIGESVNIETKNSIIVSDKRLIATVGLEDIIIVDTDDVLLVTKRDDAQRVKEIINILKTKDKKNYL